MARGKGGIVVALSEPTASSYPYRTHFPRQEFPVSRIPQSASNHFQKPRRSLRTYIIIKFVSEAAARQIFESDTMMDAGRAPKEQNFADRKHLDSIVSEHAT
eukprot:scaffold1594_cov401-Prasinococcus_capsulatus_cf.AAC.40